MSEQGVLTLVLNGDNASKFSAMEYSTEELKLAAAPADLKTQGLGSNAGQMALKVSMKFKFDSKTCTGSATAKFSEQTSVTVKCN